MQIFYLSFLTRLNVFLGGLANQVGCTHPSHSAVREVPARGAAARVSEVLPGGGGGVGGAPCSHQHEMKHHSHIHLP